MAKDIQLQAVGGQIVEVAVPEGTQHTPAQEDALLRHIGKQTMNRLRNELLAPDSRWARFKKFMGRLFRTLFCGWR